VPFWFALKLLLVRPASLRLIYLSLEDMWILTVAISLHLDVTLLRVKHLEFWGLLYIVLFQKTSVLFQFVMCFLLLYCLCLEEVCKWLIMFFCCLLLWKYSSAVHTTPEMCQCCTTMDPCFRALFSSVSFVLEITGGGLRW